MRNLYYLIERFHLIILLIILEGISLAFLRQKDLYHDTIVGNFSAQIAGNLYSKRNQVVKYFGLAEENKRLAKENALLFSKVRYSEKLAQDSTLPQQSPSQIFSYIPAKIIDNSLTESVNYLMLDKGYVDGVEKGLGVIAPDGVVGIVVRVSKNFSIVMSVISTKSRISVKHQKSGVLGNLTWDGNNPWVLKVDNVSKTNNIAIGDTFQTAGYSNFFPPEIPTAIVTSVKQDPSTSFLQIHVRLSENIDKINYVYIVESKDKAQIDSLKSTINLTSY